MFKAMVMVAALTLSAGYCFSASAAESKTAAEVKQAGHDAKVDIKKAGRNASDAACETVNGKVECAGKKAKHKIQNAADEATK